MSAIYDNGWRSCELGVLRGSQHDCSNFCCKKKQKFLLIMNKFKEIRYLQKYQILMNLCKFEVEVYIFYKKKWSKIGHKWANFYYITKLLRTSLDNLITKSCAKLRVDWMKIVWLMLLASSSVSSTVIVYSRHFEKKITIYFYTLVTFNRNFVDLLRKIRKGAPNF